MENPKVQNCFEEFSLLLNENDIVFQKSKDLILQKSKDLVYQSAPMEYPGVYRCIHGCTGVYMD